MQSHFLQSEAWEKFQNFEGKTTYRLEDKDFSLLAIEDHTPLGNYLFIPYGPTLTSQAGLKSALAAAKKLAVAKKCLFIRLEPTIPIDESILKELKLQKTKDIDPKYTLILDLDPSEDTLLSNMEQRKRRYYKTYEKKGISIRTSHNPADAKILTSLLSTLAENNHFQKHSDKYLTDQINFDFSTLYIAEFEGKPIAAALVYDDDTTRYYAHAATDYEHRNLAAGAILVVKMIMDAKALGLKYYDFWGITISEDPKDPWYGFTRYKKTFGGYQKSYGGTYDYVINHTKYNLYTALRPINRLKRKILHK